MAVKTRPIPFFVPPGTYEVREFNSVGPTLQKGYSSNVDLSRSLTGIQVTVSESHPQWRKRRPGVFSGDYGGEFSTDIKRIESASSAVATAGYFSSDRYGPIAHKYVGPMLPLAPSPSMFPPSAASTDDALKELGATAIARCSPSNASADLSVMLGELVKDGLPHIVGGLFKSWLGMNPRQRRQAIGSEYLNIEFAWKPLVNDLKKIGNTVLNAEKIWAQYERDAGRPVRRRYEFPATETVTSSASEGKVAWLSPSLNTLYTPGSPMGRVILTKTVRKEQWFSGAFTYVLPGRNAAKNEIASTVIKAKKLLGLTLTPDTLWNLAPWSWAVDWFSNTGDTIDNWSNWAIDGQVLLYGYMMEHTISSNRYTFAGPTGIRSDFRPHDLTFVHETKRRIKAGPYGFGVKWDGMSPRQIAIAASLGLTKS